MRGYTMKNLIAFSVLALAVPNLASAGEIYGKITSGGAVVPEGTTVEATCGAKAYPAVKTDRGGSYDLVVNEVGKCTLTIGFKRQSASLAVASYDDAAQVDIVLDTKEGKLTARRR
jgi:hypothetical protein